MSGLVATTLGELIDSGKLPSGNSFALKPDTVENALLVGEAQDDRPWREKLLQAQACVATIAGKPVDEQGGVSFLSSLPDADIVCITMAWTAEANGRVMALAQGVPCPECTHPFHEIPLGPIKLFAREQPLSGPDSIFPLDLSGLSDRHQKMMPAGLQGASFYVRAPTWKAARAHVSKRTMAKPDMVNAYRAMAALMHKSEGGSQPTPTPHALAKKLPSVVIRTVIKVMDEHVPYMAREIAITCKKCGTELDVPFDQADDSI